MVEEAKTRSNEKEVRRASAWEKTRKLALILSHPGKENPDQSVTKPTFDEALEEVYGEELTRPSRSLTTYSKRTATRWIANSALRQFIKMITNPEEYPAEETRRADELLEEIRAQNRETIIEPSGLYDFFGIKKLKKKATSSSNGSQGMQTLGQTFTYESSLPQPETDPRRREIDIVVFLQHLREAGGVQPAQFIGKAIPTQSSPINMTPLKNRGSGI